MVSVNGLGFSYYKKTVLQAVSFEAGQGACVGIAGKNGCGKSTLLSILAGARIPSSGSIRYNNEEALQNRKVFERYVGYVPQTNPLISELSALDNLRLWYSGSTASLKEALQTEPLAALDLQPFLSRPVHKLSEGMKKRVTIALALLKRPSVLILDEPSASLDLICKEEIHAFLALYLKNGGTVILATHEEAEFDLCTDLYVLSCGTLTKINPALRGTALTTLF